MPKSLAVFAGAVAMVVSLTGCGMTQHIPGLAKPATASDAQASPGSSDASAAAYEPQIVQHPWQPGQFQKGIQLTLNSSAKTMAVDANRTLDYIVKLGANSVSLSFPISVDSQTPLKVYAADDTPSVKTVQSVVQAAKTRKLRVTLRPFIEQVDVRRDLDPINPDGFFRMYQQLLGPYLKMASDQGVDEFVLGDEMTSLQTSKSWYTVAAYAKYRFKGELSYDLNADWQTKPPGVDSFGVNFYPTTTLGDAASIDDLAKVFSHWISKQQLLLKTSLTLDEVDIHGVTGAFQKPYQDSKDGTFTNPAAQAKWFTAAWRAAKQADANGIYFAPLSTSQQFGSDLKVEDQPSDNFVGRSDQYIKALFG